MRIICIIEPAQLKTEIKTIKLECKSKQFGFFERPLHITEKLKQHGKIIAELTKEKSFEANCKNKLIEYNHINNLFYHSNRIDMTGESLYSKTGIISIKTNTEKFVIYHDYENNSNCEFCIKRILNLLLI